MNVVVLGDDYHSGVYLLRIRVMQPLSLAVGRFRGGRALGFPVGDYLYVGSALATKGATSLAMRLLRHATRSSPLPPHQLRATLAEVFAGCGLGNGQLPTAKRLHWHVDYLLDQPDVELSQVFVLRTDRPLEAALAEWLAAEEMTFIIQKGLGARDYPEQTHLLGVRAPAPWWAALPGQLQRWLEEGKGHRT